MEENLKQQHSSIIKIALFGPESTGKTTLAKQLAEHFKTVWAAEFARDYLQSKWNEKHQICEPEDLLPIAIGQTKLENDSLMTANEYLFCDTCLLTTKVFSEMYYEFCDPILDKAARKHKYDLFFLTDIDVPWEQDDLRDRQYNRITTFETFKGALLENNKPFITLSGSESDRLSKSITIIRNLVKAKEMGFTSHDFVQIYEKDIQIETIRDHLKLFRTGISKVNLVRSASKNDGILSFSEEEFEKFTTFFDENKEQYKLKKFVPASGAASRMFKFLNEFLNDFDLENDTINSYINKRNATQLTVFLAGLEKFPFFESIHKQLIEAFPDFKSWPTDKRNYYFIKCLLGSDEFNYGNKPKGIIPFHKYASHIATPIEEHLNEGAYYATSNAQSNLHFTISEIHRVSFEEIIESVIEKVQKKSNVNVKIAFSTQNPATDTIAVNMDNTPFRNDFGELVFRPAGHGALIGNLNQLNADIVFIKNIDNVIQNHIESIAFYKKGLAGKLIQLQRQLFHYLTQIDENLIEEIHLEDIISFAQDQLNMAIIEDFYKYTLESKISYLKEILNRPIRVCGMVKNEGEPGGGPFWIRNEKGSISLQIIETSQIELQNSSQAQILASSTYFNPVDLVCGIKDYRGNKFNLHEFVDPNSGFIVLKNKNGKELKAYELPGLWNGAMANWNTVFVEVPLLTFNPVKTVNDLLKSAHQPQ